MIRVVQRRLIIPRGDTGNFTLPLLPGTEQGDVAIFSIYDPQVQDVILRKEVTVSEETLTFEFARADTINLEPSTRYEWDVRIYHGAIRDADGVVVDGNAIDSYYAAFKLPQCEIAVAP